MSKARKMLKPMNSNNLTYYPNKTKLKCHSTNTRDLTPNISLNTRDP